MKDGFISKEDYEELHAGFTEKRNAAETEIRSINAHMKEVLAENTDKYRWMSYFTEHRDIKELTRAVAVELIQQVRVIDKNNIEVTFSFDDSFCAYADMLETHAADGSNIYAMPDRNNADYGLEERQVI